MGEAGANGNGGKLLPPWFYLARALVALFLGAAVIWHETSTNAGVSNIVVIASGLLLLGYAPTDLIAFYRGTTK